MNKSLLCRIGCDEGGIFLVGKYEVKFYQKPVGTMEVSREGLYYLFRCKCKLPLNQIFRITVSCGNEPVNLGVLIPCNDTFCLDTKRPIKLFAQAEPLFTIISDSDNWIPVRKDRPFSKIEDLESGIFRQQDGVPGILFIDSAPSPQGNDPNP